jgi:sulfite exporter TauE/SafE
MLAFIAQAFLLGLSVGPACLGYCAPVCGPYLASEERVGWWAAGRVLTLFLLGCLAGYTLVGAGVGLVGRQLLSTAGPWVWGVVRLGLGLLLIAFGFLTGPAGMKWCPGLRVSSKGFSFAPLIGLLTGLNLCPPFAAAIAGAAGTGSSFSAVLYFWSFFVGTSVYLAPLVLLGRFSRFDVLRQIARICLFLAGGWFVLEGLLGLL